MTDPLSKFYKAEEQLLDTCGSTLATAREYLQLPKHCQFVWCEKDSARFQAALPSLMQVYAKHVLILDYYITASEEAVAASKGFVWERAALAWKRKDDSWTLPPRHIPMQTSPVNTTQFLENV